MPEVQPLQAGFLAPPIAGIQSPAMANQDGWKLDRFFVKRDWPRATATGPGWILETHGRRPGFRLRRVQEQEPPKLSYSWFGSFDARGIDLVTACGGGSVSGHIRSFMVEVDGVRQSIRDSGKRTISKTSNSDVALGYETAPDGHMIHFRYCLNSRDGFSLRVLASDALREATVSVIWKVSGVFEMLPESAGACRSWSDTLGTGLLISPGNAASKLAVKRDGEDWQVQASGPARKGLELTFQILDEKGTETEPIEFSCCESQMAEELTAEDLPKWEVGELQRREWAPELGRTKERVAGLFVSDPRWRHLSSADPAGNIDFIEQTLLDQVLAAGAFDAIGLSRDGITEFQRDIQWRKLVARCRKAGFRVYMKPGDQELEALEGRDETKDWARNNFAVREEERVDVLRLPWEAVLVPWTTADLCVPPQYLPADRNSLRSLAWPAMEDRIVTGLTDRFSFLIEDIRTHDPKVTIDLECGDTRVFEKLLERHENLGVMFMCYGDWPRVEDYLRLCFCLACDQLGASRIILETDCYYTTKYHQLNMLLRDPPDRMYSAEDLEMLKRKQAALVSYATDAAWSWGLNLCHSDAKFSAVCSGVKPAGL